MGTDQRTQDKWILSSILLAVTVMVVGALICFMAYNVGVYIEDLRHAERQKIEAERALAEYVEDVQRIKIIPAKDLPIIVESE